MLAPATSGLDEAIKVESAIATVAERQTGQFGGLRTVTAV